MLHGAQGAAANCGAHTGAGAAQTGAGGGQHAGPRFIQPQGHSRAQQQPLAAGSIATASKISTFFMVLCLLGKQRGITASVVLSDFPIQTFGAGIKQGARSLE